MLETSARLLRLLSLFQAQRYWSGADLAERLEVTSRTLRRDVDRSRSLGYPVNSTTGTAGGYQLGSGANLPPLQLDDDEAVAVAVGLRTAASGSVTGIEESSLRALAKLEQVLPERLRRRVSALHGFIVPLAGASPTVDAGTLASLAGACRDCVKLRFGYQSRTGEPSRREVEPHRLVHTGRRWYLIAWDLQRNDWRTFRVDRIEARLTTGVRFPPRDPPDGDFAAYASRSVAYAPYPYRARVKVAASVQMLAERIPASVGMLEAIDDQTCMLHTGGFSLDSLSVWMALIGYDFEVQDPPEMVERVRQLADRFHKAAGGPATGAETVPTP
jgi:predicted DNA-binding transcriptional regulator YafY